MNTELCPDQCKTSIMQQLFNESVATGTACLQAVLVTALGGSKTYTEFSHFIGLNYLHNLIGKVNYVTE